MGSPEERADRAKKRKRACKDAVAARIDNGEFDKHIIGAGLTADHFIKYCENGDRDAVNEALAEHASLMPQDYSFDGVFFRSR